MDGLGTDQRNASQVDLSPTSEPPRSQTADPLPTDRYALAAHLADDGFWEWDLHADRVTFSARWKAILGYREDEFPDRLDAWFSRVPPEERIQLRRLLDACRRGERPSFEFRHRICHRDGGYRWVLCRGALLRDATGAPRSLLGVQIDLSRSSLSAGQRGQVGTSPVTHLPDRNFFIDHLRRSLARAQRQSGYLFAVLYLDLDEFRHVNESFGHLVGDQLLEALAQRLVSQVRANDVVAHLGGDEFVVLLDGIRSFSDATRVTQRLRHALAQPFEVREQSIFTSLSIGIAIYQPHYRAPEELLRDAHIAVNRAKTRGKAQQAMFDPQMYAQAVRRLRMEAELREALESNQFELHYQPIFELEQEIPTHVEALIRWNHPQLGMISPLEFIGIAEETGLIVPIGAWVLQAASDQVQRWRTQFAPTLRLAVNISAVQFQHADLPKLVCSTLDDTGLDANALELEITESTAMMDADQNRQVLHELASMGVQISLDDFGTGYSSFEYLKRFAIHTLKIDRAFVKDIPEDPDDAAIVRAILAMAHSLHLKVTAEGIETKDQLEFLRSLQCEEGQGYFFSRPLPASEMESFLRSHIPMSHRPT